MMAYDSKPDKALVFNGGGPGSRNMIQTCQKRKIEVDEWKIDWTGTGFATDGNSLLSVPVQSG
jgi:hypothetical protein